uniref:Odorant receptor n=1 Tax=Aulacocentrum confusum TaxID=2767324 RepID=A0A7G8Z965_9HYME|nr:olfactory receptor 46 [Aulacocentrum confusum]
MKLFDHNKFQNIRDPFFDGHYAINRKMWEILGIWPEQKLSARIKIQIMHVLITISVAIPEIVYFVEICDDLDLVAQCIPTFLVIIAAGIKFFTMGLNSELFLSVFNSVRADWITYGKSFAQETLYLYANKGYDGTLIYTAAISMATTTFLILPIVPVFLDAIDPLNETRETFPIFETDYGVDREKYIIPITLHAYLTTVQVIGLVISVDTVVLLLVQHCCSLFQIVELILDRLKDESKKDLEDFQYKTICDAIELHKHAINFADILDSTFSKMYGAIVIMNTLAISFTGFETVVLLERKEYEQSLRFVLYALGQIAHLFLNSMPGQELMDHSEKVFYIIYNSNWTALTAKSRKLIALSLMRTLKPCTFAAGGFYVMNMQNFASV